MASNYSPDLRIELITNGEQSGTWGTTTNTNLGTLIEDAISGAVTVTTTTANQALTIQNGSADEARSAALILTTSSGANYNVYAPPVTKLYVVKNSNATYSCTLYASSVAGNTTAAGTGVTIPPLGSALVRCDGTNMVDQLNYISGNLTVGGTTTFTGNTTLGPARLTASYAQGSGSTTATFTVANTFVAGSTQVYIATISGTFVSAIYTVATASSTNFTVTATAPTSAISGSAAVTTDLITINGAIGAGVIIDGTSTLPALRVTQKGTGNALVVSDAPNPDISPFIVDSVGRVITGATGPITAFSASGLTPRIQELGTIANDSALGLALFSSTTNQIGPSIELARAATSSIGTFTAVPAGALLGTVNFSAADSAKFRPAASISAVSAGASSTTSTPAYLSVSTIPALTNALVERLRVNSDGNIILGAGEASATTTGNTLRGPDRTGANAAGANLTIAAGNGTGTGGSGSLVLQTAPASTTTGSVANVMVDRLTIQNNGLLLNKAFAQGAGLIPGQLIYGLAANFAGSNGTTAQSIFGKGVPLIGGTTYAFEMTFVLSKSAGTASHTISLLFDYGTTVNLASAQYTITGVIRADPVVTVGAPTIFSFVNGAAAVTGTTVTAATTTAAVSFTATVKGVFVTNASATPVAWTPQYKLSAAPGGAYSTLIGSYVSVYPLASGSSTINIGGWA